MGEYFNPMKRKVGMMTMAMACLFMVGWVRSISVKDGFMRIWIGSAEQCLIWGSNRYPNAKSNERSFETMLD